MIQKRGMRATHSFYYSRKDRKKRERAGRDGTKRMPLRSVGTLGTVLTGGASYSALTLVGLGGSFWRVWSVGLDS